MTLPASFPLSASEINIELGRAADAAFSITGAEERALAGVPTGPISFSDFLGKSSYGAEFLQDTSQLTALSTYTFSGENFGAAASTREIFVGVSWAAGALTRSISSATIGGVAATIQRQTNLSDSVSQSVGAAVIFAAVPTGTSGDIVITFSGGNTACVIGSYRVIGRTSFSDDTVDSYSGPNPVSVGLANNTIGDNGISIGAATSSASGGAISWTGVNTTYDVQHAGGTEPTNSRFGGGFITGQVSQINYEISAQQTSISEPTGAVMASVCIQ
jgi:hypothetical protein